MEAARIDWKNIESIFVEDVLYEHFHAPKWVDLSSPSPSLPDDLSWFCKHDCNHPMTADDFLPSKTTTLRRSSSTSTHSRLFQGDVTKVPSPCYDAPLTPVGGKTVSVDHDLPRSDAIPRLKSTLSTSNLFAGRDLLKHISEFCSELKKLTTRTKANGTPPPAKAKSSDITSSPETCVEGKERSPLLDVTEQASDALKNSKAREKKRINRRVEDAENVPISIELDKVGQKGHLSQKIRTSPPTPQCFSSMRSPASKTGGLKERQILGEVKMARRRDATMEENINKGGGMGAKTPPDVFWFLKPCTLSR